VNDHQKPNGRPFSFFYPAGQGFYPQIYPDIFGDKNLGQKQYKYIIKRSLFKIQLAES
jgi:hypothetical protein